MFANYEHERRLLNDLCVSTCFHPILLIRGTSGIGKSRLLRSFTENLPPEIRPLPVQLRPTAVSIGEILFRLCRHLAPAQLPLLNLALFHPDTPNRETLTHSINIDDNALIGYKNKLSLVIYSHTHIGRSDQTATLTEALFSDLENAGEVSLIIFDSFDQAVPEVADWISGPLLGRIAKSKNLRAVIAGQAVPNIDNIEWGSASKLATLGGVAEATAWLPIVEALGKLIPHSSEIGWLTGVCDALEGHPAKIMQLLEALPEREAT